jgi:hypothetical protein
MDTTSIDWHAVAAAAAQAAAEINNAGYRFGIDPHGDIGTHLFTDGERQANGVYLVRCQPDIDVDALADELADWIDEVVFLVGAYAIPTRRWETP